MNKSWWKRNSESHFVVYNLKTSSRSWDIIGLFGELTSQTIVDIEEVVGIFACVLDHSRIERPLTPVGLLILFLCLYMAELVQQIAERVVWIVENTCRLTSVEHVHYVDAKVLLQPFDIRVSAMQYLTFNVELYKQLVRKWLWDGFIYFRKCPVGEDLIEAIHLRAKFDSVHDKVVCTCRDLH